MPHVNYFEIKANSYQDLGLKEGQLFAEYLRKKIKENKRHSAWVIKLNKSKAYLPQTQKAFPYLMITNLPMSGWHYSVD